MGSLDMKSDSEEAEVEVENNKMDSPTTSDLLELVSEDSDDNEVIVQHSPPPNEEKASCYSSSSSSSSDFMLEDPFQDSHDENTTNKDIIESPPIQTMERLSPTPQKYRIPSSVFARRESYNIDGWGMPSNESLFSIKMGGMSFRNQDSLNWKSGELDLGFGLEPSPSGKVEMIPEMDETCESDVESEKNVEQVRHHKMGEEDKIHSLSEIQGTKSAVEEINSHFSAENVASRTSFAFPILTADTDKQQSDTQSHSEPQPEPDKLTEPSKPKADPPVSSWTNCFGCCTFCS